MIPVWYTLIHNTEDLRHSYFGPVSYSYVTHGVSCYERFQHINSFLINSANSSQYFFNSHSVEVLSAVVYVAYVCTIIAIKNTILSITTKGACRGRDGKMPVTTASPEGPRAWLSSIRCRRFIPSNLVGPLAATSCHQILYFG